MRFLFGCTVAVGVGALTSTAIFCLNRASIQSVSAKPYWLEAQLAEAVIGHRNTLMPAQVDEAVLRWLTAEHLPAAPQIAIFGSSHSLSINSDFTTPYDVSNFSISGGSLADHLITTQILNSRGLDPQVCLVVIDPWYFDRETDFIMWTARPDRLARMETILSARSDPPLPPLFRDRVARYYQHPRKLRYSIEPLLTVADNFLEERFTHLVFTERNEAFGTVLLSDGSIQGAGHHRDINVNEAQALAIRQFTSNRDRHRYGNFHAVDPVLWALFEQWLLFLQEKGHKVVLMLSPYHPAIYPNLVRDGKNQLRTIEDKARQLSEVLKVPLVGSYDPKLAGVNEADFFDGDHLRSEALGRLLGKILNDAAKAAGVDDNPVVVESAKTGKS